MSTEIILQLDEDLKALNEAFRDGRAVPADVDARLQERTAAFRRRILEPQDPLDIAFLSYDEIVKLVIDASIGI